MRDAHRIKEKYDLSLDNRQIVSLVIAGIVVLGAVFVLGVVVGKKLSENEKAADAPDLLTALDAKAAALEKTQGDPALTFQEELTRKATPEPGRPDVKVVSLQKPPASAPAEKADKVEKVDKVEVAAPAAAPQPTEPPGATVAAAPVPQAPPQEGKVEEETIPARTSGKAPTRNPSSGDQGLPSVGGKGTFTLQLSATQTREEAQRFVASLKEKGYASYIVEAEVPGKGTWFRVRMGSFPTREAATRYLQDFKRETQIGAFVAANE